MNRLRKLGPAVLLAAAVAFSTGLVQGQSSAADRSKQLGQRVMCNCGCGDIAGSCSHPGASFSGPCDVAKSKLKEIGERVGRGESDSAILDAMVGEYGEQILAAPTTHGFSFVAWAVPGIVFALGLGLVVLVIRQWRHRIAVVPSAGPAVSAEMLARARREVDRQTDD